MKNHLNRILLNKAGEVDAGGAPANPPANPPAAAANNPPAEGDGDNFDELGYEKRKPENKEGDPPKEADDKKKAPAKKSEKVENPVTGYGDEPPKVDEPPAVDPNKKVDPPPPPTELEKKLEGMHPQKIAITKAQIEKLGLEGEKLDEFIAQRKQELKDASDWVEAQNRAIARENQLKNQAWHKELKEDPVFGGDKFAANVTRGEKVLDEYLPELKKELTEAKQMLRPSVMRGLARLADQLYPEDKLVQGDPPPPEDEKGGDNEKNDPLAFYE